MAKKSGPNKDNLEATRRSFIEIARREFSNQGFYAASTSKIVEESGMARGSLYYHFEDKKALFKAVYSEVLEEMASTMRNAVSDNTDPWDALVAGCLAVLDTFTKKECRRIIIDVQTALTYIERIESLKASVLKVLDELMGNAYKAGYLKKLKPEILRVMIFGMLSEGGRSFEISEDIQKSREELGHNFKAFMEGVRA